MRGREFEPPIRYGNFFTFVACEMCRCFNSIKINEKKMWMTHIKKNNSNWKKTSKIILIKHDFICKVLFLYKKTITNNINSLNINNSKIKKENDSRFNIESDCNPEITNSIIFLSGKTKEATGIKTIAS